ncbi:MAG: hypothetical protein IE909_10340 [Campylobacterales bacterium]|nr:hypothetical protein [Campylobacterales bacterium]
MNHLVHSPISRTSSNLCSAFCPKSGVVNENFEPSFAQYDGRALLFWGKADTATPLYTGEKISQIIKNSQLYPLDGDHYFFLNHAKFIADTIMHEIG